jgi:hypothetical protein
MVKPVLDIDEHIHVGSYEASERLKDQTEMRDLTCVFPTATRRHAGATTNTASHTPTTDRPARATSRPPVGVTTAPRPPAAGAT